VEEVRGLYWGVTCFAINAALTSWNDAMLVITVHVNRPTGQAIGIKEQIAMDLEKYGDTRVVSVKEVQPEASGYEQMRLGDSRSEKH